MNERKQREKKIYNNGYAVEIRTVEEPNGIIDKMTARNCSIKTMFGIREVEEEERKKGETRKRDFLHRIRFPSHFYLIFFLSLCLWFRHTLS